MGLWYKADVNLYLIERTSPCGYDEYDSAVVAAESEEAARKTHPDGQSKVEPCMFASWEHDPSEVKATLIGSAVPGTKAGVICASFNAG